MHQNVPFPSTKVKKLGGRAQPLPVKRGTPPRLHPLRASAAPLTFQNMDTLMNLPEQHTFGPKFHIYQHSLIALQQERLGNESAKQHAVKKPNTLEICFKLTCLMYKALTNTQLAFVYSTSLLYCSNSFIIGYNCQVLQQYTAPCASFTLLQSMSI